MGGAGLLILLLGLLSLGLSGYALSRDTPLEWRFVLPDTAEKAPDAAPEFVQVFDYSATTGQAHAPAILLDSGQLRLIWFEGSAEAQADVDIRAVTLSQGPEGWTASSPGPLITRGALGAAFMPRQAVVTLGNVVQNDAEPGRVFATVVSVGGWAMASVADVHLAKGGVSAARKLNLSPFLNRSHLVKSPMVGFADGTFGLPAYFEMGATHGSLVRFTPDGRVRDQRRISRQSGVKPIQPMIVALSELRAVSFLRDFDPSGRLWISRTEDGGQSWSAVMRTDIPNPSAPVAALRMDDARILMAMNDDAENPERLRLALSGDDGATWRVIHAFDDGDGAARYPMLRRLPDGRIMLAFSHGTKRGIRAFAFNDAWVAAQ